MRQKTANHKKIRDYIKKESKKQTPEQKARIIELAEKFKKEDERQDK